MAFGDRVKKKVRHAFLSDRVSHVIVKPIEPKIYIQHYPESIIDNPTYHWLHILGDPKGIPNDYRRVNHKPDVTCLPGEHTSIYWFSNALEMKVATQERNCFISCNRQDKVWDCWLLHYPEHRCKYRLTLPK